MQYHGAMKPFDPAQPFAAQRPPVLARNVVACSQPLAAQAGLQMLARGGNAIDAALAAAITLTVVEPVMNGIGGDGFSLVWDGARLHGLNASGRSPAAWTPARFAGRTQMPPIGWDTVTVSGAVSQWVQLSVRFGALPFADLFEPAIRYATDGFAVSPVIARQWAAAAASPLAEQPGFAQAFLPGGRAPRAGERWTFAAQARTLADIAATKGESFYRGRLANLIADWAQRTGGAITADDLAAHEAEWVEPIRTDYHGYTLHEIPPNGSGVAALIALGVLERLPVAHTAPGSAERLHLQIEAMRLAFADAHAFVGEPAAMRVGVSDLLDPDYLGARAALVDPQRAGQPGPGAPTGGTVYLCAADAQGRMVSLIQSNYHGFGSGVVVPDTGIALHNRGLGFKLIPGHPDEVGPRKRPFHTILPAFLSRDGAPVMAFGVMGGNMQPQGHVQVAMRYVDDGLNPQACSDAPRWRIDDHGRLVVEAAMPAETVAGLRARGHDVEVRPADSLEFGSCQAIARLSADLADGYVAGSDHRRDGQAVGF